ncbi:putative glycosyltransferase EpsJ [Clostridiales bacterium CHKCI001]|nr:putative glycosyltransferase EpsJ [Clostridiales bacterium CHKCI001]
MEKPTDNLVSIVIPLYNATDILFDCLESVSKQTYQSIEVICVDDGSQNCLGEIICKEFQKKDPRFFYYRKKNGGPGSARNYGIRYCKGNYILFIDSDDTIEQNMVNIMVEKITDDNSDIVICGYFLYQNKKYSCQQIGRSYSGTREDFICNEFERLYRDFLINAPWNKMIRSSFLHKYQLKFYEEFSFLEDLIFSLNLIEKSSIISVVNQPLYNYHYFRPGALTTLYHAKTDQAILLVGEILERGFLDYLENKAYFYGDLIHKSLIFFYSVRVNQNLSWKDKYDKIKNLLLNPQYQSYLYQAKSDRLKMKIKILGLKLVTKII